MEGQRLDEALRRDIYWVNATGLPRSVLVSTAHDFRDGEAICEVAQLVFKRACPQHPSLPELSEGGRKGLLTAMELLAVHQSETHSQGSVDMGDPVATTLGIASGDERVIHGVLDGLQRTYSSEETKEVGRLHAYAYANETPWNEEAANRDNGGVRLQGPPNSRFNSEMQPTPQLEIEKTRKPFRESSKDPGMLEAGASSGLSSFSDPSLPLAIEQDDGDTFAKFQYTNPHFGGGASNASKESDEGGAVASEYWREACIQDKRTEKSDENDEVALSDRPCEPKQRDIDCTAACGPTGSKEAMAEESVRRTVSEDCAGQRDVDLHESILFDAAMLNRTISDPVEVGIRTVGGSEADQSQESITRQQWSIPKEFRTDFVVRHLDDDFLLLDHAELVSENGESEAQPIHSQLGDTPVEGETASPNPLSQDLKHICVREEPDVRAVPPAFESEENNVSAPSYRGETSNGQGEEETARHAVDRSAEISRDSEKGQFLSAMFARRKALERGSDDAHMKPAHEHNPLQSLPQTAPSFTSQPSTLPVERPSIETAGQSSAPTPPYTSPRHGSPRPGTIGKYRQLRDDLMPLAWCPQEGKFFMNKRAKAGTESILDHPSWNPSTSCIQHSQAPLEWDPTNYPYECEYEQYLRNGDMGMSPFSPVRSGSPADYEEAKQADRVARIQEAREKKRAVSRSRDSFILSPTGDFSKTKWKWTPQSKDLLSPAHPFQCDSGIAVNSLKPRERKTEAHDAAIRWDAAGVAKRADLECSLRAHSSLQLEALPKPFNKRNLPYSPSTTKALQESLFSWTTTLGLIKEDPSQRGFACVLDGLRKGTLLCSLARVITSKNISGVCRNPLSQSSRAANILKACKVFRGVRGMSWRHLNYQEQLIGGSGWALTGLLEDIHRLYDGLPPRPSVVWEGDQPYIPDSPPHHLNVDCPIQHHGQQQVKKNQSRDNVGATKPESKKIAQEKLATLSLHNPYCAKSKRQQSLLKAEEDCELGSSPPSTKHRCGCAMRRLRLELCEWLTRKGINVHWQTPLEEACKDGALLCKLVCILEKCSLPGVQDQPRSNAAAAFNLSKALGILRKTPKMPLRYLWKEKDLLEGREGVAVGLLKDVRTAYKHEDCHAPRTGYVWHR